MPPKRKIDRTERPSFTNWAIGIVAALIVLTSAAIVALLVITAGGGPDLSAFVRTETARSTATPRRSTATPRPTEPVWETPARQLVPQPSLTAAVPPNNLPTRPVKPVVGNMAVSGSPGETSYVHPTYQPTTEPCSSCHEETGRGQ